MRDIIKEYSQVTLVADRNRNEIRVEFDYNCLPDLEQVPRGAYLKEIYAGGDGGDQGFLIFSINKKAVFGSVIYSFLAELDLTQEEPDDQKTYDQWESETHGY